MNEMVTMMELNLYSLIHLDGVELNKAQKQPYFYGSLLTTI
jgi:hypothetical protein